MVARKWTREEEQKAKDAEATPEEEALEGFAVGACIGTGGEDGWRAEGVTWLGLQRGLQVGDVTDRSNEIAEAWHESVDIA